MAFNLEKYGNDVNVQQQGIIKLWHIYLLDGIVCSH